MRKQVANNQHMCSACGMCRATWAYRVLVCAAYQSPCGSMVNCVLIIVSPAHELGGSILHHALFLFYIINGITQLNAIDPCGVLLGDFIFPVF